MCPLGMPDADGRIGWPPPRTAALTRGLHPPVNGPDSSEQALAAPLRRAVAAGRAMMLSWQGVDGPRLETVRVLLDARGMRASGTVVSAVAGSAAAFAASYSLATDEAGVVSRLSVRCIAAGGERQLSANRSEEGIWLVDHGYGGAARTRFDGAMDVDVAECLLFNALPVRRLRLHREFGAHQLAMVYVDLPSLAVQLTRQDYRTVAVRENSAVVELATGEHSAALTLDTHGMVTDYPGLARRL